MNRPQELYTNIFLDSGSALDTKEVIQKLGFLDGQTTNPTYFVKKNPDIKKAVEAGKKFTRRELFEEYKRLAEEISPLISAAAGTSQSGDSVHGSVSIEVYANKNTSAEEMIDQGREIWGWIDNAHIKLPIIAEGLKAAEVLVGEGKRVNMTLCFSEEQAAAVHAATRGAAPGQVYISPFISRLDKIGQNGFDLLKNIQKMYKAANSHVSILAASVHSIFDIAHVIETGMDIITIPYDDMLAWIEAGTPFETSTVEPKDMSDLAPIEYKNLDVSAHWSAYDISHALTDKGLEAFASDWDAIIV